MTPLQQAGFPYRSLAWAASLVFHSLLLGGLEFIPKGVPAPTYEKVSVNVVQKTKPQLLEPLAAEEPKAEKPKTKAPPQAKPTQVKTEVPDSSPPPEPVLGLSKDSFAEEGKGTFSVPAGNSTMVEDQGKRLAPEEVRKLDRDLSEDAKLVAGSFIKPDYTPEAEDTGLEGAFVIEVYIDATGKVLEAELLKKIGFGMDERVLNAAKKARFSPRKNPLGQPLAGWTELKIRLTLE